ncbi:hypothetical protein Hanom_Chr10g00953801 [Helianthus anomalus]
MSNDNKTNPDHRRSVAACLVQGVYILERDRQENRQALEALAPPWWKWNFFQFDLHSQLQTPTFTTHPVLRHRFPSHVNQRQRVLT